MALLRIPPCVESRRSWLAAGMGLPALVWVDAMHAQAPAPVVIGWLIPANAVAAQGGRTFIESMAALGWREGAQYAVVERSAQGQLDRLPALAREIAAVSAMLLPPVKARVPPLTVLVPV